MANQGKKQPDPRLTKDPDQAAVTNDELLALHTSQGEVIARQEQEIADLKKQLAALQANTQPKVARSAGGVQVKVAGTEYLVVHGVVHEGRNWSPEQIAANKDLCIELLAGNSTALRPA